MKSSKLFLISLAAFLLVLSQPAIVSAQNRPNFDPQQMSQMMEGMQQRIVDSMREQLVITNDMEWNAIKPLLAKVVQGQMDTMVGGAGALRMFGGNRGGNFGGFGQSDPEREKLQKVIDAGGQNAEVKNALASFREARKRKAEQIARDREQLRKVLTPRQEAVLVLAGLLD